MKDRRRRRLGRRSPACRAVWLCGVVLLSTWAAFGLPDDDVPENDASTTSSPTPSSTEEIVTLPTPPTTQQQQQHAPMVWPAEPSPIEDAVEFVARRSAAGESPEEEPTTNDDSDDDAAVPTLWPATEPLVAAATSPEEEEESLASVKPSVVPNDDDKTEAALPPVPTAPVTEEQDSSISSSSSSVPSAVPTLWPVEAPVTNDDDEDSSPPSVPTVWPEEAPVTNDDDDSSPSSVPTVWPEEAPVVVRDDDNDDDSSSTPPAVANPHPDDDNDDATIELQENADDDDTILDLDDDDDNDNVSKVEAVVTANENAPPAEPVAKAPPGSLASFFEILKERNEGQQPDVAAALASRVDATDRVDETPPPRLEEDAYWGIWGGRTYRRRADLSVLTMLFQDLLQAQGADVGDELGTTNLEDLLDASLASTGLHADDISIPEAPQSQFLEGLDDLDKLFEDVDPPDELDISLGSSMQEILVGRGIQIVRKRVVKGLQALQRALRQIRLAVKNKITTEEGSLRLVSKEELVQAGQWLVRGTRRTYDTLQIFLDDLFEGNGEDETILADDDMLKEIQKRTGAS